MRQYTLTPRLATMQTPINPPALPGSPSQPTDPSPCRHGPAKWTATAFIGIARHCQKLMALDGKRDVSMYLSSHIDSFCLNVAASDPRGKCDNCYYLRQRVFCCISVLSSTSAIVHADVVSRVVDGETANAQVDSNEPPQLRFITGLILKGRSYSISRQKRHKQFTDLSKISMPRGHQHVCCYCSRMFNANQARMNRDTRPYLI